MSWRVAESISKGRALQGLAAGSALGGARKCRGPYASRPGSNVRQLPQIFNAEEDGRIVGGIVFSRLTYAQDARTVFILAPVTVATDRQRNGIGQGLLTHGLAALSSAGVDIVMTYGDPDYYAKVGFMPVSEAHAQAPCKLTSPKAGWASR